ncbi:MAG TPA: hypothetical protein VFV28_02460 [Limnobacter sp.]|nr:hypothetical protein [Limnobacter sp.]
MSFRVRQGIVPQLGKRFGGYMLRPLACCVPAFALMLAACSTVQMQASKPLAPTTLEEARGYVAGRERAMEFLEYELNQKSRECYERFFVSSCLDEVRLKGAELRRAHLEVQGQAEDLIRLDEYGRRQNREQGRTQSSQ